MKIDDKTTPKAAQAIREADECDVEMLQDYEASVGNDNDTLEQSELEMLLADMTGQPNLTDDIKNFAKEILNGKSSISVQDLIEKLDENHDGTLSRQETATGETEPQGSDPLKDFAKTMQGVLAYTTNASKKNV